MADLKPKSDNKEESLAPAPAPSKEEVVQVPIEVSSLRGGINITIEGDYVTLELSQYIAEHIGQFRACSFVRARFKHGTAPDITAIFNRGEKGLESRG